MYFIEYEWRVFGIKKYSKIIFFNDNLIIS